MDQESGSNPRLSKEQKLGAVLLLVFGILAVGLGMLQMRNNLYSPFGLPRTIAANAPLNLDAKTRLQQIDTDHDGMSDYDEIEFHETSPYLPDTDSDGINDKEEIQSGGDPLCPKEQNCSAREAIGDKRLQVIMSLTEEDAIDPVGLLGQALTGDATAGGQIGAAPDPLAPPQQAGITQSDLERIAKDPAALRALLLEGGQITKEQLDQIDDATLLQFASQIVTQTNTGAGSNSSGAATATGTVQ